MFKCISVFLVDTSSAASRRVYLSLVTGGGVGAIFTGTDLPIQNDLDCLFFLGGGHVASIKSTKKNPPKNKVDVFHH